MKKWLTKIAAVSAITLSSLSGAYAGEPKESDWYLYVDVNAVRDSAISQHFSGDAQEGIDILAKLFGQDVIEQVNSIAIYGDMEPGRAKVAFAQGDFSNLTGTIKDKLLKAGLSQTVEKDGQTVYFGKIDKAYIHSLKSGVELENVVYEELNDDSDTTFYAAMPDEKTFFISQNLEELVAGMSNKDTVVAVQQGKLFEVVVDVEKSFVHGGMNMDEANVQFESISAKQLQQVSASYKENNGIAELQIGLKALDDATATKVQSVAKGLMALKLLSEKDPGIVALINDVQIEQVGSELFVSLTATHERISRLLESFSIGK